MCPSPLATAPRPHPRDVITCTSAGWCNHRFKYINIHLSSGYRTLNLSPGHVRRMFFLIFFLFPVHNISNVIGANHNPDSVYLMTASDDVKDEKLIFPSRSQSTWIYLDRYGIRITCGSIYYRILVFVCDIKILWLLLIFLLMLNTALSCEFCGLSCQVWAFLGPSSEVLALSSGDPSCKSELWVQKSELWVQLSGLWVQNSEL